MQARQQAFDGLQVLGLVMAQPLKHGANVQKGFQLHVRCHFHQPLGQARGLGGWLARRAA